MGWVVIMVGVTQVRMLVRVRLGAALPVGRVSVGVRTDERNMTGRTTSVGTARGPRRAASEQEVIQAVIRQSVDLAGGCLDDGKPALGSLRRRRGEQEIRCRVIQFAGARETAQCPRRW